MSKPALRLPVSRSLRDPVDEPSIARIWRGIEKKSAPGTGFRVRSWILIPALALVLFAVFWWSRSSPGEAPRELALLTLRNGAPIPTLSLPPHGKGADLELADGSRIRAEPGTELEPLAVAPRELVLRLASGEARFDVVPGGPRRWIVETGIARVEVVGTRFSVSRSVREVRVSVEHGVVLVRASSLPDGVTSLSAGQTVAVPATPPPPSSSAPSEPKPHTLAIVDGGTSAPAPPSWREQARLGKHAEAYVTLGSAGLSREAQRAATPDDLFTLADVARLSGHPAQAVEPLERFLAKHPGDARASLAALTLGRIQLDLGRAGAAAQSLQRALGLGVPGGLVEDAYARLVEAQVKSGQTGAARVTADEYAKRFPNGRKKASIEAWFVH